MDDSALAIETGKGLVIVTGCSHAASAISSNTPDASPANAMSMLLSGDFI